MRLQAKGKNVALTVHDDRSLLALQVGWHPQRSRGQGIESYRGIGSTRGTRRAGGQGKDLSQGQGQAAGLSHGTNCHLCLAAA